MAENGILDYQGMNQAIYRGATSNIIVDTQSMSIEIGAGNSSHTSNLHIECDHDANVASIQLNSNVVTEFSRSKKLIKYPRVAMTSASYNSYESGYKVTVSGFVNSSNDPWKAFNGIDFEVGMLLSGLNYDTSGNANTTGTTASRLSASDSTPYGEWLKLELPNKIKLDKYVFTSRNNATHWTQSVEAGQVWGSNDDLNWTHLHTFTGSGFTGESQTASFDVQTDNYYKYYAFIVTKTFAAGSDYYLCLPELKYFGTPEYDSDAHGTDVTVKSYPNVPNTDWLEVYYDGQDYSDMPSTVDNKTGVSTYDATPTGGVGFDSTYKAFTFDSSSNQYLSTSTPMSGNYVHSFSMWFKPTNLTATSGDELLYVGANGTSTKVEVFIESDRINYTFGANDYQAYRPFLNNVWHHLVLTYNGVGGQSGREIYLDGVRQEATHTGSTGVLAISTNNLDIGRYTPSGSSTAYAFDGSIANFRLFNRVLTSEEIYQLYAYQKEDFGHGTNNMTLKAGRLGIGTSEPRGALDVRGDAYYGCPVFFTAYYGNSGDNNNIAAGSSPNYTTLVFNYTMVNKGGAYDLSNGRFTAPISGHYEVLFRGGSASTAGCQTWIFRNGVAPTTWTASGLKSVAAAWDSSTGNFRNLGTIHFFDYFEAGEYLDVRIVSGSFNASNYNSFSVKYLSN